MGQAARARKVMFPGELRPDSRPPHFAFAQQLARSTMKLDSVCMFVARRMLERLNAQ